MKRILLFLCFLPWLLSASSQELPDSAKLMAEMEDSISGMYRPYQASEGTAGQHRRTGRTRFAAKACSLQVSGNADLWLTDFPSDHFQLHHSCCCKHTDSCMQTDSERTVIQGLKYLISLHHIKVYSISDEKGRVVYRVDFSPRKHIGYGYCGSKFNGTAYFDKNFHIQQIETDKIGPTSYDIMGRQDKKGQLSHTHCRHYRMVFDEVDGTPVVKQIESTSSLDNQTCGKFSVQRLP